MTRVGLQFQRHRVGEGGRDWQSPADVAKQLGELGIKIEIAGEKEPITPEGLLALGEEKARAAGIDWQDAWRLLDDVALEANRNQVVDLRPDSVLARAMGVVDGVDANYGRVRMAAPTEPGAKIESPKEISSRRREAVVNRLRARLEEPLTDAKGATISQAEALADALFVSRRSSATYVLLELGPDRLAAMVRDALPSGWAGDDERSSFGREDPDSIAAAAVKLFEAKLAAAGAEGDDRRWSWLAAMRENIPSLEAQDALTEWVEISSRGNGSTWWVHNFAEGLSSAALSGGLRSQFLDAVRREPVLLSNAHNLPHRLAKLPAEQQAALGRILTSYLNASDEQSSKHRQLALDTLSSLPEGVSTPVAAALMGWATTSESRPWDYLELTTRLDRVVAELPATQAAKLLALLKRPEVRKGSNLSSLAAALGDPAVLALPPELRETAFEQALARAAADESAYSSFDHVPEIARPLVAMAEAKAPAAYQQLVRDVLLSVPNKAVKAVGEAATPLGQLGPAVLAALARDAKGKEALSALLQAPPRWGAGTTDPDPAGLPPSDTPFHERVTNQFLLDADAGQAAQLVRGELTVPNHEDPQLVRIGQRLLSAAGEQVVDDGRYGSKTRAAIEQFQTKHELPVTGALDGPTLALLAAVVGAPGLRTSSLGLELSVASAAGGPWEGRVAWTPAHRAELGRFSEAYRLAHPSAGKPGDGGALALEVLVAFARQRNLPLGAAELGRSTAVDLHRNPDPLAAARKVLHVTTDERASTTWRFYRENWAGKLGKNRNCLETFNEGIRTLFRGGGVRPTLGSTVDLSLAALRKQGFADDTHAVEFADEGGRHTTGVNPPHGYLKGHSVAGEAAKMAGVVPGWHFFGYSMLDGDHSILLALDNRDPANPRYFWGDQWSASRGWKPLSAEGFDARVIENTVDFWKLNANNAEKPIKFKTQSRVTRIRVPG